MMISQCCTNAAVISDIYATHFMIACPLRPSDNIVLLNSWVPLSMLCFDSPIRRLCFLNIWRTLSSFSDIPLQPLCKTQIQHFYAWADKTQDWRMNVNAAIIYYVSALAKCSHNWSCAHGNNTREVDNVAGYSTTRELYSFWVISL